VLIAAIVVGTLWAALTSGVFGWYIAEEIGDTQGVLGWLMAGLAVLTGVFLLIHRVLEVSG